MNLNKTIKLFKIINRYVLIILKKKNIEKVVIEREIIKEKNYENSLLIKEKEFEMKNTKFYNNKR